MMGASRASLAELRERFDARAADGGADALRALAADLRSAVHLLDAEHGLRRALSDPAQPGEHKAGLIRELVGDRLGADAVDILTAAVALRWSAPGDLPDAIEQIAVLAEAGCAERDGALDAVEDELFRFGRIVVAQPELRTALTNPAAPESSKVALLSDLLGDKVTPVTLRLVTDVVLYLRGRSLERGLEAVAGYVAQRRRRLIARVRTAVPLDEERKQRLAAALTRLYGHEVHLNIELDPDVVGGVSVQVDDEVIDGTIAGRLDVVRRRLAG